MPPHPLTNFEIQKYYQNEPKFNGVYFRDNLTEIRDGVNVINLDEYSDIGTHWVVLYVNNDNNNNNNNNNNNSVNYFDYFGVEHIPKEIEISINNKNIKISKNIED